MNYGPDFDSIWVHDWDKESTGEDEKINRCDGETHTRRLIEKRTARGGRAERHRAKGGGWRNAQQGY